MKKLLFLLALLILTYCYSASVKAQGNFETTSKVEYKFQEDGKAIVTNTITIKNTSSNLYVKSYVINLSSLKPENIKAFEKGNPIAFRQESSGEAIKITLDFQEAVAGLNKTKTFVISYEDNTLATHSGEVWEVTIPKLVNKTAFKTYVVEVSVPEIFREEAYIFPEPNEIKHNDSRLIYYFDSEKIKNGITAGFGQFQVFAFKLTYHLENPLRKSSETTIAIPPDTTLQRVFYENIEPKPERINVDDDGNWLAQFTLEPREQIDINVAGSVQIYASPRKVHITSPSTILANTKPTKVWQTEDPEIKNIAQDLKTPQNIYNFVVETLNYNFENVKPNVTRLGAKVALKNPNEAICMEFTDLFIALARSNGIPAREINGFAESDNRQIQPLSLVSDVLHSWPEYWDASLGTWVPVDPTWESTSGIDYFNKFDLKHFTFVIHGKEHDKPYPAGSYKLGPNPQKDVYVTLGTLPEERLAKLDIEYEVSPQVSFFKKVYKIRIFNNGPVAVYEMQPEIYLGDKLIADDFVQSLTPFSAYEKEVEVKYGFFNKNVPEYLTVFANETQMQIPLNKDQVIIQQLLIIVIFLLGILIVIYYKLKGHFFINSKTGKNVFRQLAKNISFRKKHS